MTSGSSVPGVSTTANGMLEGSARAPLQVLGQDDFLKLLVTQMTQQDPMNPQKDTEFIAQMASFSALEQSKTMQQDMANLRAASLLGNTVTVKGPGNSLLSGQVELVEFAGEKPSLVFGGVRFQMSDILDIRPTIAQPAAASAVEPDSSQTQSQ